MYGIKEDKGSACSPVGGGTALVGFRGGVPRLAGALILQVFPSTVNFCLELLDQILITLFEEVFETSLCTQKILDWEFFLWLIGKCPLAMFYLK